MEICIGYEKDCMCQTCDINRREWVAQESVKLAEILQAHLEKIQSMPDISNQPERSKREDIGFFKKLMMRCSEHYRNIVRGK